MAAVYSQCICYNLSISYYSLTFIIKNCVLSSKLGSCLLSVLPCCSCGSRKRYIPPFNLGPNYSELLQRPVCYNSCMTFSMKIMHKMYATLTRLNIFTFEDFLRKKHLHPECTAIQWMARRLPTHWLLISPTTIDLQQTLYGGVVKQGWSVKAIYAHLCDSGKQFPMAMTRWDCEIGKVGGQQWTSACRFARQIRDVHLQNFHLLFLNRGYALNDQMAYFSMVTPQCRLCHGERETYKHLFWACSKVQHIIDTMREVGVNYLDQQVHWLSKHSFLLGSFPSILLTTLA